MEPLPTSTLARVTKIDISPGAATNHSTWTPQLPIECKNKASSGKTPASIPSSVASHCTNQATHLPDTASRQHLYTPTCPAANARNELPVTVPTLPDDRFLPHFDQQALIQHAARVAAFWPHPTKEAKAQYPGFCSMYDRIKHFNLPNALGARITLKSRLNLEKWEHYLADYHDKEVCSFLRFGWPLGYSGDQPPK